MTNGKRIMLLTKDSETFRTKLDEALEAFHGGQQGTDYGEEGQIEAPQVIDAGIPEVIEPEIPNQNNVGESSTENDDVPY